MFQRLPKGTVSGNFVVTSIESLQAVTNASVPDAQGYCHGRESANGGYGYYAGQCGVEEQERTSSARSRAQPGQEYCQLQFGLEDDSTRWGSHALVEQFRRL